MGWLVGRLVSVVVVAEVVVGLVEEASVVVVVGGAWEVVAKVAVGGWVSGVLTQVCHEHIGGERGHAR